jgi:hypothetical protein
MVAIEVACVVDAQAQAARHRTAGSSSTHAQAPDDWPPAPSTQMAAMNDRPLGLAARRLTPKDTIDRVVEPPVGKPNKPMFGGPALDVLYVTSLGTGLTPGSKARQPQAGGRFMVKSLGVRGVSQARFKG